MTSLTSLTLTMSLRQFSTKNSKDQTSLEKDRKALYTVTTTPTHNLSGRDFETPPELLNPSTYTSNVTTVASHTLAGRDSTMRQPGSSLTDTFGVAEKSKVATTNYSKRLSVSPQFSFVRILLVYYRAKENLRVICEALRVT